MNLKVGPDLPGRSPDVMFMLPEHRDRIHQKYVEGPADLVIEVVGPNSRRRDLVEKHAEYEAGGVPEYWALEYERCDAIFRTLGGDGKFEPLLSDADGYITSRVLPVVRVRPEWFWREPLPKATGLMREWSLL